MITSIYISDSSVEVAVGTAGGSHVQVKQIRRYPLPEGCLVNGEIHRPQQLTELLAQIRKECRWKKRRVRLVINSDLVNVKRLTLPAMSEKKLRRLLPHELEAAQEDMLVDFQKIESGNKQLTLYGVSVPRRQLEPYREALADAGFRLEQILVSRFCIERFLGRVRTLQGKTCIVELFDDLLMTSVLLVDGVCGYFSQSHVSASGSFQFGLEVSRSVSNLRQFFSTQDKNRRIEEVYLCGISEKDFLICEEALSQMVTDIGAVRIQEVEEVQLSGNVQVQAADYIALLGSLFSGHGGIRFDLNDKKQKGKEEPGALRRYGMLPALVAAGCVAVYGALYLTNEQRRQELGEIEEYLASAHNLSECERADALALENGRLAAMTASVEYMDEVLASYPHMNSEVLAQIEACAKGRAEAKVESYDGDTGMLTLNTEAGEVGLINEFIDALQETGLFHAIDYTGYTYSGQTGRYAIHVSCYLKEQAGKEGAGE